MRIEIGSLDMLALAHYGNDIGVFDGFVQNITDLINHPAKIV